MKIKRRAVEAAMGLVLLGSVFVLTGEVFPKANKVSKIVEEPVIVIDAGHGGIDPGKVGIDGMLEKDINLAIAKKLQGKMEAAGYRVVMTRENDCGLYVEGTPNQKVQDLQNRCKVIAETKPLCTISIHQNSYTDEQVCGPQVFYFTHSVEAEALAAILQEKLNTGLEIAKPRVQKENSSYYILKRSSSVTVLVECGFLSNPEEAVKLTTSDYQEKLADAVCKGIEKYRCSEKNA